MTSRRQLLAVIVLALLLSSCIDCSYSVCRTAPCGELDPAEVDALLRADPRLSVKDLSERNPDAYESQWARTVDLRLWLDIELSKVPCTVKVEGPEACVIAGPFGVFPSHEERARWLECLDYLCRKLEDAFPEIEPGSWAGDE